MKTNKNIRKKFFRRLANSEAVSKIALSLDISECVKDMWLRECEKKTEPLIIVTNDDDIDGLPFTQSGKKNKRNKKGLIMENQKLTFYGEPISKYGIEQGFIDYQAIANAGNLTLCNNITKLFQYFNFERINENETSEDYEVMQWYIIDAWTADILTQWLPDEILYYCEELDLTLWGVTHCGTRWDYVLTPIKIVKNQYGGFDFEKPQLSDNGGDDE